MKGELHAPLLGSICWGDLDYSEIETGFDQHLTVTYDMPMQFDTIYLKNTGTKKAVVKKGTTFIPVTINETVSEYELSFNPTLVIDSNGIDIYIGNDAVESNPEFAKTGKLFTNATLRNNTLVFTLLKPSTVSVSLYTASGKKAADLFIKKLPPGENRIPLDLYNLARGIYFCRLKIGNTLQTFSLPLLN